MKEARYKEIMEGLPMPDSRSILAALKQVANEVAQEVEAKNICEMIKNKVQDGEKREGDTLKTNSHRVIKRCPECGHFGRNEPSCEICDHTFSSVEEVDTKESNLSFNSGISLYNVLACRQSILDHNKAAFEKIKKDGLLDDKGQSLNYDFGLAGVDLERFQRAFQKTMDLAKPTAEEMKDMVEKSEEDKEKKLHEIQDRLKREHDIIMSVWGGQCSYSAKACEPIEDGSWMDAVIKSLSFGKEYGKTKKAFIERDLRDMDDKTFDNLCSYNLFSHSSDDGKDDIVKSMSEYTVFSITNKSSAPYIAKAIDSSNKNPSTTLVLAAELIDDMKDVENIIAENGAAVFKTVKELTEYLKGGEDDK